MKILYVLIIVIVCFVLNLAAYYSSDSYRKFLKEFKWVEQNTIISKDEYDISVNYKDKVSNKENELNNIEWEITFISSKSKDEILKEKLEEKVAFIREQEREEKRRKEELKKRKEELEKRQNKVNRIIHKLEKKVNKKDELKKVKIPISNDVKNNVMSIYDKRVLKLFTEFNLVELKYHWKLLDVTSEYPDKYFEYYSMDLTLLFFPNKWYNEIKDIFSVESNWYNFMINEVDNFWDESFYVNLWENSADWDIRVIFKKNGKTFWFKVSKTEYSKVKNILKQL